MDHDEFGCTHHYVNITTISTTTTIQIWEVTTDMLPALHQAFTAWLGQPLEVLGSTDQLEAAVATVRNEMIWGEPNE